jgi:phage baseplate assembly protein W
VILEVSEPAVMTWQARVSVRAVSLEEELEESLYVLEYATKPS